MHSPAVADPTLRGHLLGWQQQQQLVYLGEPALLDAVCCCSGDVTAYALQASLCAACSCWTQRSTVQSPFS